MLFVEGRVAGEQGEGGWEGLGGGGNEGKRGAGRWRG